MSQQTTMVKPVARPPGCAPCYQVYPYEPALWCQACTLEHAQQFPEPMTGEQARAAYREAWAFWRELQARKGASGA